MHLKQGLWGYGHTQIVIHVSIVKYFFKLKVVINLMIVNITKS